MARKFIDCRDYKGEVNCTLALSAANEEELLKAAVAHGVAVHGYSDTPELRKTLLDAFKEGHPAG